MRSIHTRHFDFFDLSVRIALKPKHHAFLWVQNQVTVHISGLKIFEIN